MIHEHSHVHGHFQIICRDHQGIEKWREAIDNVVATVGKNLAFDTFLAGSSYTVTGPYLGLISGTSFTGTSASDTMSSHSGWLEAGNSNQPTYSGTRGTAVWSAASGGSKALSSALTFNMTGTGTVQGAFMVYGSGAVNTVDNTSGTLWSAGSFASSRTVANGDTVTVNYSVSM